MQPLLDSGFVRLRPFGLRRTPRNDSVLLRRLLRAAQGRPRHVAEFGV